MILRSFLVFIILFISYSLFHTFFKGFDATLNQWQENQTNAEKYIYQKKDYKYVIVGSSLSKRFNVDTLENFYNLSFAGKGIFEGLEIIKKSDKLPKVIFIEINYPLRTLDDDFLNNLFSVETFNLKKYFFVLRSNYSITSLPLAIKNKRENKMKVEISKPNKNTLTKMLKEQRKFFALKPQKQELNKKIKLLKDYTNYFNNRKCKIVFFEMPIHNSLFNMPYTVEIRNTFKQNFKNYYSFIEFDYELVKKINTSDGIHLNENDISFFSEQFYNKIISHTK